MNSTEAAPVAEAEVVDGTAVEVGAQPSQEVAVRQASPSVAVMPEVTADQLVGRLDVIRGAMESAMQRDIDYGVIPGTNKPALLKPGAEKLAVLFQLDVQIVNEKRWEEGGHLTVVSRATAFHAPSGSRLGYGEGICTTREKKYAKRRAMPKCPDCGKENIRRSKQGQQGFYCWQKTDGCGANFPADDDRILGQPEGEVDNPDLPDTWNTVVKMAEKRARIDAILAVTGASALFTQDMEDAVVREDNQAEGRAQEGRTSGGAGAQRQGSGNRSAARPRPTAEPKEKTEPTATASQRRLINAKAAEKECTQRGLANIVLEAVGQETRPWEGGEEQAQRWLRRQMERLPKRLVDPIIAKLEEIE